MGQRTGLEPADAGMKTRRLYQFAYRCVRW